MDDITELLERRNPGDGVTLEVLRDRREVKLHVQLTERPVSLPAG